MNNSNNDFSFNSSEYQNSWSSLFNKWDVGGIESLTDDEKIWFVTKSLIGDIQNGGLFSFFYNSGADNLDETLKALNYFEANELISRIEQISALFGENGVPGNLVSRNELIRNWGDKSSDFLEEIDNEEVQNMARDLHEKLGKYLISNQDKLLK